MTWIDVSQALEPGMTVWPGDTAFESSRQMDLEAGDPCQVSSITLSLHAGTHADAPRHYELRGAAVADCDVSAFLGPAHVVDVRGHRPIEPVCIESVPAGLERILFKTGTGVEGGWHDDFSFLSTEVALALVSRGVKLVGMDTPSVDDAHSTSWPVHRILAAAGVVILENLRLSEVDPGLYELVALPLKLKGLEASPVRALLRRLPPAGAGL